MQELEDSIVLILSSDVKNTAFGSGFIIARDQNYSYLLTCAHVLDQINGKPPTTENKLKISGVDAPIEIVICGASDVIDIVLLKVAGLFDKPLFEQFMLGQEQAEIKVTGYSLFDSKNGQHIQRELKGKLNNRIKITSNNQEYPFLDVSIQDDDFSKLEGGYSGSPLYNAAGQVLGVISHRRSGEMGHAFCISNLKTLYPEIITLIPSLGQLEKNSRSKEDLGRYMKDYLDGLMATCASLGWFEKVAAENENVPQLTLDSVYTALLTSSLKDTEKDNHVGSKEAYSAVEMLNRHDKLVIVGAPGSGKSAFVNFLCLCMAGELLQSSKYPHCNLALLTQPLPDDKGKPQKEKQQWQHGALVPLRIILRDFASSTHFPDSVQKATAQSLLDFIKAGLSKTIRKKFYPLLSKCLSDGDVLVMFDGLDEVPEADKRREVMKKCIEAFCNAHSRNRFLMTVRPYAYQDVRWRIGIFTETALANFSRGQICLFIDLWYQDYDKQKVKVLEKRAEKLKEKIFGMKKEKLQEMAERPLLLTLIAFLDCNQHQLPERRAELYKELLKILIEKWEKARFDVNDATEARDKKQLSLSEYLRVGYEAIHLVLQRLAFNAHALQPEGDKNKCADISAETLRNTLFELAINTRVNPVDLDEYLRDRVGILNLRGGDNKKNSVYSFPHRSFQEYLAAEYFDKEGEEVSQLCKDAKGDGEWEDFAAYLGQTDPGRWREVVILAGAIYAGKASMRKLIKALLTDIQEDKPLTLAQSWGLRLAGEILAENIDINPEGNAVKQCRQTLQTLLPKLLNADTLPALERATAGRHLAKIGDSRPEIMDVDAMQFCFIPAGEFYLGGDDKAWNVGKNSGKQSLDDDYALARFPVTVAQYKQFVEATNHQMIDKQCIGDLDNKNTPVVYVTWDEAIKFCDWLTIRWQQAGYLNKDWRVDLPSEAEWEKAAKGGLQIPVKPEIITVAAMTGSPLRTSSHIKLTDNLPSKRIYPWGDEIDHEKLNYEMKIASVSALGCYPLGQSPYGCEEMAGNVWEWTLSTYQENYPVNPSEWKKRNDRAQKNVGRVLRGGAFLDYGYGVRCAARGSLPPDDRYDAIGFRVALCPHTSDR